MIVLKIILLILAFIGLLSLVYNICKYCKYKKEMEKIEEERFCPHCEKTYLALIYDNYKYCPLCGRKLTFLWDCEEE